MKLSKKLFAAGVVAALTLSVAASALAAELTVKTKKINEGQVKIATPVIAGSEGGVKDGYAVDANDYQKYCS